MFSQNKLKTYSSHTTQKIQKRILNILPILISIWYLINFFDKKLIK